MFSAGALLSLFPLTSPPGSFSLLGAGIPEESTAGAGRQVCVGGESVHHRGQLQLLRRGGLSHGGQGTGKSLRLYVSLSRPDSSTITCRHERWQLASHFLSTQLFLHASLTPFCRKANSRSEVFSASCRSTTDTSLVSLLVAMCPGQDRNQEQC